MRIRVDLDKSLEENAEHYFKKAKKARKKLQGAKTAYKQALIQAKRAKKHAEHHKKKAQLKDPEKHWYHKYRWSRTRNGHLLVAGQNASANEAIIKNHAQPDDIIFHTDMSGSPFTILRPDGDVEDEDLEDAAQLTAAYSKAWERGMSTLDVFHVKPEQVTKEAQSGEYLAKGSFMIRGDTSYHHPPVELAIGVIVREGYLPEVFVGSKEACEQHTETYAVIGPGPEKTSDTAKTLKNRFGGDIDTYVRAIPAGGSRILDRGKARKS